MESYHNLISSIDIDRHEIIVLHDVNLKDSMFLEFKEDIQTKNDHIELSLIAHNAYKEAVILNLTRNLIKHADLFEIVREQQTTFGGSKLFYFNDNKDKILVLSVQNGVQSKLMMVIHRLSKANEKVHRLNSKIKKENANVFLQKHASFEERDLIVNLINKNLKL